jgi:hypothetical protein
MVSLEVLAQLARCDQEIAEIQAREDVLSGLVPAWLVTLGVEDWEAEARELRKQLNANRT